MHVRTMLIIINIVIANPYRSSSYRLACFNIFFALEITDTLVRSGAVDLIVIDSVAALVPQVEPEGGMADNQMGLQARLMSKALRKLTSTVSKSNSTVFSSIKFV